MTIWQEYTVTSQYAMIKFKDTIDISTLINANFIVDKLDATPVNIANPFKTIDVIRDYYSVSRILYLWWNITLESNKDYRITVSNLLTVSGIYLATDDTFLFDTDNVEDSNLVLEPPTRIPTDVEDYSVKDTSTLYTSNLSGGSSAVSIVKTVPETGVSYYLKENQNEGKIEIWFSQALAANYISSTYFRTQRKRVSRNMARWEDVTGAQVTADSSKAVVYIYLPSIEATPVYGYQVDKDIARIYFEKGYKYRVVVSQDVAA
jgi:hypothetical protein